MKNFIFVPNTLICKDGFIDGFVKITDSTNYYITSDSPAQSCRNIIGYCGELQPERVVKSTEWIYIDRRTREVSLYKNEIRALDVTCIYYDYSIFKGANAFRTFSRDVDTNFAALNTALQVESGDKFDKGLFDLLIFILIYLLKFLEKLDPILKYSTFYTHCKMSLERTKQNLGNFKRRASDLFVINAIFATLLDVIMGSVMTYFFLHYEKEIITSVHRSADFIITGLKTTLHTLMDSPAGLKLNYGLNQTLAIFFFYHISLWKAFIITTSFMLPKISTFFMCSGFLGVSFQVALLSDFISFMTFHVYCIYVYAARLYGLQIYGITALWKLFIGRKYNPLRSRVDSFQYSYNQLFVGTLGFTVLIFLFPTVFLYYAVFSSFRVCLIILGNALNFLRFFLKSLPLYTLVLWIFNSSQVRGLVKIQICNNGEDSFLYATLKRFPLCTCLGGTLKSTWDTVDGPQWGSLFKGIFMGILL